MILLVREDLATPSGHEDISAFFLAYTMALDVAAARKFERSNSRI